MRCCSWSPACREQTATEFCDEHAAVMVPLFSVKVGKGFNKSARAAALDKLDSGRAEIVAALVAKAGTLRLDGSSDALQRAVEVAAEAGWIASTRDGRYTAGSVEIGRRPALKQLPTATAHDAALGRAKMIAAYIERSDHAPTKKDLMAALNFSAGRATSALAAGREAGMFYARRGPGGYRLGREPAAA